MNISRLKIGEILNVKKQEQKAKQAKKKCCPFCKGVHFLITSKNILQCRRCTRQFKTASLEDVRGYTDKEMKYGAWEKVTS